MKTELTSKQIELISKYQQLEDFPKLLVEYLAALYEKTRIRELTNAINSEPMSTIKIKKGSSQVIGALITKYIQELRSSSLVVQSMAEYYECNFEIKEWVLSEAAKKDRFVNICKAIELEYNNSKTKNLMDIVQLLRLSLYRKDTDFSKEYTRIISGFEKTVKVIHNYTVLSVFKSFDLLEHLKKISPQNPLFLSISEKLFYEAFHFLKDYDEEIEYLISLAKKKNSKLDMQIVALAVQHLIYQGNFQDKEKILQLHDAASSIFFQQALIVEFFIQGDFQNCITYYDKMIEAEKKLSKKRNFVPDSFVCILYFLCLLKFGKDNKYAKANAYCDLLLNSFNNPYRENFVEFKKLIQYISGAKTEKNMITYNVYAIDSKNFWYFLSLGMSILWIDTKPSDAFLNQLNSKVELAKDRGYKWIEMQLSDLVAKFTSNTVYQKRADAIKKELGSFYISDLYEKKAEWKYLLDALNLLAPPEEQKSEEKDGSLRLIWIFYLDEYFEGCRLEAIEQTYHSKKGWLAGKAVSLRRLKNETDSLPYLSDMDKNILSTFLFFSNDFKLSSKTFKAMVGHPHLYYTSKNSHVQLEEGKPELRVLDISETELKITLHPPDKIERAPFAIVRESPTKFKYIEFTQEHNKMLSIIGYKGLIIPKSAKDEVLNTLGALSGLITIQSDIGGHHSSNAEIVEPNSTLHIQLYPLGPMDIKVTVLCRPFGEQGPYYKPVGAGKVLMMEIEGKKLQTTRNFEEEQNAIDALLQSCPILSIFPNDNFEWIFKEPENCLQALLEFQALGDQVVIEWPEGEKFKIKKSVSTSSFKMGIKRDQNWFSVSGELAIDDTEVLQMQTLLELLDQSKGRFVKLNDGSFLALTLEFKKQLEDIKAISEHTKNGYRISNLATPLLEDMASQVAELKADVDWKKQVKKLKDLKDFQPKLPSTFQATLREYQKEGFEWLSKLSKWGVGACLADDMGLGKTIQALTVLLEHAPHGPSLVIAPTSVCMNWHNEVLLHAPTLNTIQFGSGDRERMIDKLRPFDLLVCTYGMIQQAEVAEILKKVKWKVIVLDEAQAIKNMSTKRSQAVMSLEADFKLITTGTPIENHLGELWNLFRFLNPGLLGSLESFNQRFAIPIERNKDKEAGNRLKRLIQPFILRRMKNEVLLELPEKTDITLQVELSEKERAFYEALRLNAIHSLTKTNFKDGQKHLQILAEIMKLRRACCNTKLVQNGKVEIPSAKLTAFTEILEELLENKHKALVFSQFVDHLSIVKDHLDSLKVSYQYLDGSTPMKERTKRVNAFQAGEGEVFLISLKAGGSGLNLTAADYVIHLDPWWNPAVEDQASDRAHRIGQKRPVTVYRIVAKDTIEEKIIDLHKHKRDLANSLLDETDMSGKISADELLNLLKGEF